MRAPQKRHAHHGMTLLEVLMALAVFAIAATALGTAIQNGRPSIVISTSPAKAPSIIRSPCAKVTVSVAL